MTKNTATQTSTLEEMRLMTSGLTDVDCDDGGDGCVVCQEADVLIVISTVPGKDTSVLWLMSIV